MTWIEAYRQKQGMSREQFAAAVTRELGGTGERRKCVSANLIYLLENWPKCVTHPALITMIAHACGATKAQRDQFLAKERRDYPFRHFPARVRAEAPRRAPMKEKNSRMAVTGAQLLDSNTNSLFVTKAKSTAQSTLIWSCLKILT